MTARKLKKRAKKRVKKRPTRKKSTVKRRRVVRRRVAKKRIVKRLKAPTRKPKENIVGIVTHYFPRVKAAAIKLKAPLALWDNLRIKGHTTDFTQTVSSLQINNQPITKAKRGQEIGLLVSSRVRRNDLVYKA
ncbi:MAG: hypothetical protein PVI33_02035 [Candidatus Omnitrophota bacterium]|jgi:putative protease